MHNCVQQLDPYIIYILCNIRYVNEKESTQREGNWMLQKLTFRHRIRTPRRNCSCCNRRHRTRNLLYSRRDRSHRSHIRSLWYKRGHRW